MISLVVIVFSLCFSPSWTRYPVQPDVADVTCFTDRNGTIWCAADASLAEELDGDDSF